ncbi:hypothetical protein F4808DRAFT_335255 [Astrocystis sublimbata]|nr:hypothetical protein F4808DRAFT_335255 [Astrocystis sublimbata]
MFSSSGIFNSFGQFGGDQLSGDFNSSRSNFNGDISQAAYNGSSTFGVINDLKFQAAKSSRQSTIILASFNVVSAAATAAGIFYNNYLREKRSPKRKGRVNIFKCIRGPDVYPFVLSLGIVAQGIIFAVAQGQGLNSLFQPGCALISQFMWPGIFIVPYIQLVFTIETTLRALKANPFPPRSYWTVTICLTIIKIALLATGLVTFFIRAPNFCFAALFWFVAKWADGGFAILIVIVVVMAACGVIIYFKLTRNTMIDEEERVGASVMLYYIALAIIPNTLMIPFFGYLSFGNPFENGGDTGLTLSMVSTVVANVTGLMTGGMYLFLRSSSLSSISPKNKTEACENQLSKYQLKMERANDTNFDAQIMQPVTVSQWLQETPDQGQYPVTGDNKRESHNSAFPRADEANPLGSNAIYKQYSVPVTPVDTQIPTVMTPARKASASYALFPSAFQGDTGSKILLPSTTYTPSTRDVMANDDGAVILPPPRVRPPGARHQRNSSMASSATVQIGLRLSNFEDARPMTTSTVGVPEVTYELGCPKNVAIDTNRPSPVISMPGSTVSSPRSQRTPIDTSNKTLPPVPTESQSDDETAPTLNPTVYSPKTQGKTPSPKGVGFNVPQRNNTTKSNNSTPVEGVEPRAPPSPHYGNSGAAGGANGADWI